MTGFKDRLYPPSQLKKTTIIFDPKAPSGEQKRPDHPDFWTSSELKGKEWSGMRKNDLAMQWEFWIVGEMRKAVSFEEVARDEYALTKAHVEVFQQNPIAGVLSKS